MLAVALGLLVAVTYGTGDFFGGLASRALAASRVVLWSQAVGLLGLLLVAPLVGGHAAARDLALGALAGVCGLGGVVLLYSGLGGGRMAVVAPVTAVGAALVPLVAGVVGGDALPATHVAGALLALGGVVLISRPAEEHGPAPARSPLADAGLGALAGVAFGLVFVVLARVGHGAGLWPVLAQRCASVPLCAAVLAVVARRHLAPPSRRQLRTVVPAGLCDAGANALFVVASRQGELSVVGVIASLYPASTIVLAALVLHERIGRLQGLGLLLAGAGVALLSV